MATMDKSQNADKQKMANMDKSQNADFTVISKLVLLNYGIKISSVIGNHLPNRLCS